jgi:hypothetical protein
MMGMDDDVPSQESLDDADAAETPHPTTNTDERKKLYFEWLERFSEIEWSNAGDVGDDFGDNDPGDPISDRSRWYATHITETVYLPGFGLNHPRQTVCIKPIRGVTFTSHDPIWSEFKIYNDRVVRTLARFDEQNRPAHKPSEIADVKPSYLLDGAVPMRAATMIFGHRKHGKSLWLQKLAVCCAHNVPLDGDAIKHGRILYKSLDPDAGEEEVKHRMMQICERLGIPLSDNNVRIDDTPMMLTDPIAVDAWLSRNPGRFTAVMLDPLYMMVPGDPSQASLAGPIIAGVTQIIRETGAAVLVAHHMPRGNVGKNDAHSFGSVFIEAGFSGMMHIHRGSDDMVKLTPLFVKNGRPREPLSYELQEDGYLEAIGLTDASSDANADAPQSVAKVEPSILRPDMLALVPVTAKPMAIAAVRKLIAHMLRGATPSAREKEWERIRESWAKARLIVQNKKARAMRRVGEDVK